jgi:hypothetical protein
MKCDRCGCQFPGSEGSTVTYVESDGTRTRFPTSTSFRTTTLCPSCTANRPSLLRFYLVLIAIVVLIGAAAAFYNALR